MVHGRREHSVFYCAGSMVVYGVEGGGCKSIRCLQGKRDWKVDDLSHGTELFHSVKVLGIVLPLIDSCSTREPDTP
jgi:hypothetical protein